MQGLQFRPVPPSMGRYISVRQVAGTRTARLPSGSAKNRPSTVDFGRRRPIEGEIDRRRSIEGEIDHRWSIEREKGKKKKRKRRKKEKRRRTLPVRRRRSCAVLAQASSPPAGRQRPRAVVARWSRGERSR
ncbi:hypothetical protein BHE74_00049043 [Ensete ventricosum]|nr:hypothetical protein GW17_00046904 [Ensete ventricosum]RWW45150.1 hypothetical protein BHE74_00049043 [Ensete ventricosum]